MFCYFADHPGSSRTITEVPAGQSTARLCYDADSYPLGNMTNDGSHAYSDAEKRLIKSLRRQHRKLHLKSQRASKAIAGVTTSYIRDLSGRVIAE